MDRGTRNILVSGDFRMFNILEEFPISMPINNKSKDKHHASNCKLRYPESSDNKKPKHNPKTKKTTLKNPFPFILRIR